MERTEMQTATRSVDIDREDALLESECIVSDAIGSIVELLGFKRNMGRIWAVLFLSDKALTAGELRDRLKLSTGAVSMTLAELQRWGVIRKVWIKGDRKDYYVAEGDLRKMVCRVLRERERSHITEAVEAFEQALSVLRGKRFRGADRMRATAQRERIEQLLELSRFCRSMLDALIDRGRVEVRWLPRIVLGNRSVWSATRAGSRA
jgi:DNA-binding transcriptional regulator GbsR (MarR family)